MRKRRAEELGYTEPPVPTSHEMKAAFHTWLAERRFTSYEDYVMALCHYCTIEKAAERLHWNYDLPSEQTMWAWFNALHGKTGTRSRRI